MALSAHLKLMNSEESPSAPTSVPPLGPWDGHVYNTEVCIAVAEREIEKAHCEHPPPPSVKAAWSASVLENWKWI